MIMSRTPLRMSFVGGGSDLPAFYRKEVGAVISTAVDKYIYIAVNNKFDGRLRVSYTKTEEVDNSSQVEHPLVREALKILGIRSGLEIVSMADIPSKGSGLGSSSAFTVGLLNALHAFKHSSASKETLAKLACRIEIEECREPIGKQDQYASAYGGLNFIRFHQDDSVTVDPIICSSDMLKCIEKSTLVFYTGRTRSASAILAKQAVELRDVVKMNLVRRMVRLAFDLKGELESGSLDNFGAILNENWMIKTQLAAGISDPEIDSWYRVGISNGASGGKILGAGNGGYLMFYACPERHSKIRSALSNLQCVKFGFDRCGTQIIHYEPSVV
jgi:D-glycero-alpha-D-manno-heptose-7-phosphate kinase